MENRYCYLLLLVLSSSALSFSAMPPYRFGGKLPYWLDGKLRMPRCFQEVVIKKQYYNIEDLPVDSIEIIGATYHLDISQPQSHATAELLRTLFGLQTTYFIDTDEDIRCILRDQCVQMARLTMKRGANANVVLQTNAGGLHVRSFSALSFAIEKEFPSELIIDLLKHGAVLNAAELHTSTEQKNALLTWFTTYASLLEHGWTYKHDRSKNKQDQIQDAVDLQTQIQKSARILELLLCYNTNVHGDTHEFVSNMRELAQSNIHRLLYNPLHRPHSPHAHDYVNFGSKKSQAEEHHCDLYRKCKTDFIQLLAEANNAVFASQDSVLLKDYRDRLGAFDIRAETISYFFNHYANLKQSDTAHGQSQLQKLFSCNDGRLAFLGIGQDARDEQKASSDSDNEEYTSFF